ncbi:hydroxyacid dehydrogenase [Nonomuraea sp. NPDC049480]|uniref:hydroxyacid dehydrogenase n=1 Tax=Nonomuraea sp. NPDC049480 TaxID=3364353 RepID=UPI0037A01368
MLNGLYVMDPNRFDDVYGPQARAAIERHLAIASPPLTADRLTPDLLAGLEVLVTGWGAPRLDAELLAAAPKLSLVLYGAGSIRPLVTPEMWARGVRVTSAATANATPVAEFALSQILYALKHGWRYVLAARAAAASAPRGPETGAYGAVVGLVSLGATGLATARLLAHHDLVVQAHDPYADPAQAERLGVRLVGLEELFATSDVVSLHAPLTPETHRMVGTGLLESMKPDATLINTARGGLVDEAALVDVLGRRTDLFAVLDVTDPEPPVAGSPLFTMPNIVVTPHVAGSLGHERRRHGQAMAEELARYVAGEPLLYEITESGLARRA